MNRARRVNNAGKELVVTFHIPAEWDNQVARELEQVEFYIRKGESLPPLVRRTMLGQARSELDRLCFELELKRTKWEAERGT